MAGSHKFKNKRTISLLATCILLAIAALIYFTVDRDGFMDELKDAVSPLESLLPEFTDTPSTTAKPSPTINASTAPTPAYNGTLDVYIIDVGQGDSIFLRSPSGKTMLIDTGEYKHIDDLQEFLHEQNVSKLDVVVATHPHSDHIGSMATIIRDYEVGTFYMPPVSHTSKTFEKMLDALEDKNVKSEYALAGKNATIAWDENIKIAILSPFEDAEEAYDLNNWSVILHVTYGENAILLTGDAETPAEKIALERFSQEAFEADVLKLGHHGSSTSTSEALLAAVNPKIAVASVGKNNDYGHPHKETVALMKENGIPLYRTDKSGTIHLIFSGTNVEIKTEK